MVKNYKVVRRDKAKPVSDTTISPKRTEWDRTMAMAFLILFVLKARKSIQAYLTMMKTAEGLHYEELNQ